MSREHHELVDSLERWVTALLPDTVRAQSIVAACRRAAAELEPDTPFAAGVAAIESAAHSVCRHLLMFVDEPGELIPSTRDLGWPAPDAADIRRRGGGISAVTRCDGVVTIRVDTLEPLPIARPFVEAAIDLASGATGVILDLRANGGGEPDTLARLAGFALGPPSVQLSTIRFLAGVVEWYSDPPEPERCVPPEVGVAVLTSASTFSSAEALAYHLRVRERVAIIGERTPGAADHVTPIVLTPRVHAQIPIGRVVDAVTNTNWESVGVRPDVECAASVAPQRAIAYLSRAR